MTTINPYLNFNGNCAEAFDHYKTLFGGEFALKMKFKDAPKGDQPPGTSSAEGERIMHVSLPVGKTAILMGSDRPAGFDPGVPGDLYSVSISADNKADADRLFNGLAEGGKPTMPMSNTFWGSYFGMCTDRFGIQWMVSYDEKPAG